jgi:hypothetical protein
VQTVETVVAPRTTATSPKPTQSSSSSSSKSSGLSKDDKKKAAAAAVAVPAITCGTVTGAAVLAAAIYIGWKGLKTGAGVVQGGYHTARDTTHAATHPLETVGKAGSSILNKGENAARLVGGEEAGGLFKSLKGAVFGTSEEAADSARDAKNQATHLADKLSRKGKAAVDSVEDDSEGLLHSIFGKADQAKDSAERAADEAASKGKRSGKGAVDDAKRSAKNAADDASNKAQRGADKASQKAGETADEGKGVFKFRNYTAQMCEHVYCRM